MKVSYSMLIFFFFFSLLTSLLLQVSHSTTILVDGVSEWKNPSVHIGDSIIFKDKDHYNKLYIFQNERAFNLCNFTQSSLLTKPNSTSFTWHPSRPGFFYFSFDNGSHIPCKQGKKLAIKVSAATPTPPPPPLPPASSSISPISPPPAPISGGIISSSPAYQWPDGSQQPAQAPIATSPSTMPLLPDKGGAGIPFINSNPAVPLPTGEVDSATIRPLSTSSAHQKQMVGLIAAQMPLYFTVFLIL